MFGKICMHKKRKIRSVCLSSQPLPESMVARLRESKKVCGAADTQLQVSWLTSCTLPLHFIHHFFKDTTVGSFWNSCQLKKQMQSHHERGESSSSDLELQSFLAMTVKYWVIMNYCSSRKAPSLKGMKDVEMWLIINSQHHLAVEVSHAFFFIFAEFWLLFLLLFTFSS